MKVHVVRPRELSPDDLAAWARVKQSAPVYQSPFYSHQFTRAVGEARDDARVAVIEAEGQIVGFLPFHRTARGVGKPIGGPINDYHGPILLPDVEISPQALLAGAGLTAYDYNHLPTSFTAFAKNAYARSTSPQMDLSEGYEAFLETRTSKWKKAQREIRRRRRLTEAEHGPVSFEFHDAADETYAQHTDMKNQLYRKIGVRSVLDVGWVQATLDTIRKTQTPEFAGMLTTYRAGERLIASHFGMRAGGVWHYWFPSYDLSFQALGPGIAMLNEAALQATDAGIRLIDFGRGDASYKLQFSNAQCELCEGSIARSGSVSSLLRAGQRSVLKATQTIPLGRYESYPRRALARMISGVSLPEN